jgi:hypothetical protein
MAPGALGQQTWPRRVARGVMLAASGLAAVGQQEGVAAADAQDRSRAPRGHLTAVTSPRSPLGGARSEWGLLGTFAHEDGWVNGEVLGCPVACLANRSLMDRRRAERGRGDSEIVRSEQGGSDENRSNR